MTLEDIANIEGTTSTTITVYRVIRWTARKMLGYKYHSAELFLSRPDLQKNTQLKERLDMVTKCICLG